MQRGRTALMFAAENDHIGSVVALVDAGADQNITDKVRAMSWCLFTVFLVFFFLLLTHTHNGLAFFTHTGWSDCVKFCKFFELQS
jgi:hypothetical protein